MKDRLARASSLALTASLLALGYAPLPGGWSRDARDSARSPEMNRADREANAGGYYEGLIGGGTDGGRGELALKLLGKPTEWVRFNESGVAKVLEADFLQFELKPAADRPLFGKPFTTNRFGLRDRPYTKEKPPGVFRIALLGSSMDMGWGVGTDETYENRLEDWLNVHAAKRGLARRFEVLNFAVAAYGPAQRLESFRRKAAAFGPDLVLYSATMLDLRLLEIHLCGLLQCWPDALRDALVGHFDFVARAVAAADLTPDDLRRDAKGVLIRKEVVKAKLKPQYWGIADESLGALAADCRSAGLPLAMIVIPRVGKADAPEARALPVARHKGIAARHAIPFLDLTDTFDDKDPAAIEIAAWDDHPNAKGHKLLFLALARALVHDPALYQQLFGTP